MRKRHIPLIILAGALSACGSNQQTKTAGPDPCEAATADLQQRFGPEFDKIDRTLYLAIGPQQKVGCALIYTRVPEESAEELPEEERGRHQIDQGVAIMLPESNQQLSLILLSTSESAPGNVAVELDLKDVTGDGHPEIIVTERSGIVGSGGFKGLRILTYGTAGLRTLLDASLVLKTAEGLELSGDWMAGKEGERDAILIEGGGLWQVFSFNPREQRFAFDELATRKRNPHLAPPAAGGVGSIHPTPEPAGGVGSIHPTPEPAGGVGSKAAQPQPAGGVGSKAAQPQPAGGVGSKAAQPQPAGGVGSIHPTPEPAGGVGPKKP